MGRLLDENDVYALFTPNGTVRLHVADIDVLPRVDAVEMSRLGELGQLMMPYKGCPRGRMGARGTHGGEEIQTEFEIMALDPIEDIEGDWWIPVLAEDLNNLKARLNNTVEVAHGQWENITGGMITLGDCSECKVRQPVFGTRYCKNCGAKMELEG